MVGVLVLIGILLAVCCGMGSGLRRSKKDSSSSYGSEGTTAGGAGRFSDLETNQVEMESRDSVETSAE